MLVFIRLDCVGTRHQQLVRAAWPVGRSDRSVRPRRAVYFSWPEPNSPPTWIYLGFLSNSKPSAVFKVSSLKHGSSGAATVPSGLVQQFSHNAQVGIAVEPEVQVAGLTPAAAEPSTVPSFVEFVQKMLQELPQLRHQLWRDAGADVAGALRELRPAQCSAAVVRELPAPARDEPQLLEVVTSRSVRPANSGECVCVCVSLEAEGE